MRTAQDLQDAKKSKLEMQTQWAMTRNPQCTNLFTGNEHEDSRHNVVLKMRTDARCKSISGTRAQLWKKRAQRKVGQKGGEVVKSCIGTNLEQAENLRN